MQNILWKKSLNDILKSNIFQKLFLLLQSMVRFDLKIKIMEVPTQFACSRSILVLLFMMVCVGQATVVENWFQQLEPEQNITGTLWQSLMPRRTPIAPSCNYANI